jgi:hypothetical protein
LLHHRRCQTHAAQVWVLCGQQPVTM